jgi:hypothetical protein
MEREEGGALRPALQRITAGAYNEKAGREKGDKMRLRYIALLACVPVLVSACAPQTKIATNKAQSYSGDPKRIFVLTDIGSDFGADFGEAFRAKLTSIAAQCGAEMEVSRISSLELDENVHNIRMKKFGPEAVLSIRRNGGTKNQYGALIHVIYDVRLIDARSDKVVWRANTNFYRGGTAIPLKDRAETLAIDLTNQMKTDGIFHACELIKPKA